MADKRLVSMALRASRPILASSAAGVAKDKAQGQVTINTATAAINA